MKTNAMREAIPAMRVVGTEEQIVSMVEGAADEIDRLRARLEQAERQRDEARGLLRELKPLLSYDSGSQLLGHRINAHLRDTGE